MCEQEGLVLPMQLCSRESHTLLPAVTSHQSAFIPNLFAKLLACVIPRLSALIAADAADVLAALPKDPEALKTAWRFSLNTFNKSTKVFLWSGFNSL